MTEYEHQIAHLSTLAKQEAWKHYIWARLQELDQTPMFSGIKEAVIAQVEQDGKSSGSLPGNGG